MSAPTSGAPGDVPSALLDRPVQDGTAPADPFALLGDWLPSNDDPERPPCTLATVDEEGVPDARTVLLSALHGDRVTIHTEAASRKVRQLRAHPVGAIVVRWPELARQIVLRGTVVDSGEEEEAEAFARRSRYLQLLATLNTPEMALRSRAEREKAFAEFDAAHLRPPQPAGWMGFALVPSEITFWEGAGTGPSRRAQYQRVADAWQLAYLPG